MHKDNIKSGILTPARHCPIGTIGCIYDSVSTGVVLREYDDGLTAAPATLLLVRRSDHISFRPPCALVLLRVRIAPNADHCFRHVCLAYASIAIFPLRLSSRAIRTPSMDLGRGKHIGHTCNDGIIRSSSIFLFIGVNKKSLSCHRPRERYGGGCVFDPPSFCRETLCRR